MSQNNDMDFENASFAFVRGFPLVCVSGSYFGFPLVCVSGSYFGLSRFA